MYVDVVINTENRVRILRRFCVDTHEQLLWKVQAAHNAAAEAFGSDISCIDISESTQDKYEKNYARDVYFANICGKVVHCHAAWTINPAMRPLVCKVANGFGNFSALFGPHCNLLTSSTNTVTLFRAARHSRDVSTAIEHALNADSIYSITVHMLVATARIAHPICLQCTYVDRVFAQDGRWTARTVVKTEEGVHMKSIALSLFDKEWVKSIDVNLKVPSKILVNMTKNGAVNMFMSIEDTFINDIENKYIPLYRIIVEIVCKFT